MRLSVQGWLGALVALSVVAAPSSAEPPNSYPTNPLGFFYDNSFNNVGAYKHPTAMLVTGQCNRGNAHFAEARAAGAEVLAYINADAIKDADPPCAEYTTLHTMPDGSSPPLWPYPTTAPGTRVDWPGYHMLDITVGSPWIERVVDYVEALMSADTVDGVFLDVIGAKNWSTLAGWSNWSEAEKDAWTNGNIELVRRLDASRRAINPRFIIINNNLWVRAGNDNTGITGENYVDGITIEHPPYPIHAFHAAQAAHLFPNSSHRRMLVIAQNAAEAAEWATVEGVTHVSSQATYGSPGAPPVGFHRLTDRPKKFGRTTIATVPSAGMVADRKRASKFTLAETGRLLDLNAYLDGLGGASGSQQVKLVVYRDNSGVPGAKVAESSPRTLASGTSGTWRSFAVTGLPLLTAGDYWLAIHTGGTTQMLRNFGDGSAVNWYGNDDVFTDGSSDPFGAGTSGTTTLSIHGKYVVGQ